MPTADDIRWFKEQFHEEIEAATAGTPFDLDMLTALACQETGEIWPILRKNPNLGKEQIVALCVGDTLDDDRGRRAFPRNKAALVAARNGQAMFDIAHQALRDVAVHIPSYRAAAKNANKFVHGYGVWQFDLQFFKDEPEYFLEKRYEKLENRRGPRGTQGRTQEDRLRRQAVARRQRDGIRRDRLQHRRVQTEQGPEAGIFRRHAFLWRGDLPLHPPRADGRAPRRHAGDRAA